MPPDTGNPDAGTEPQSAEPRSGIPVLRWRQWRRMWLVQAVKWAVFIPVLALWAIGTPLKMAADWAADRLNEAYVRAYNADRHRAYGRQPRRPGAVRPDGEL